MNKALEQPEPNKLSQSDIELLEKYSIQSVTETYFIVGDYKYTSLQDALASAKRRERSTDGL